MRIAQTIIIAASGLALTLGACGGDKKEGGDKKGGDKAAAADKGDQGGAGLPEAKLLEIGKLDVPGFKRTMDGKIALGNVSPWYKTEKANDRGGHMTAMVFVGKCVGGCPDLEPKAFEKKMAQAYQMTWSKVIKEDKNKEFTFDSFEHEGRKGVTNYTFSHVVNKTDSGTSRTGKHLVSLYWHDGTNQVRVDMSASGSLGDTAEEYKKKVTKDELTAEAKKMFALFAKAVEGK